MKFSIKKKKKQQQENGDLKCSSLSKRDQVFYLNHKFRDIENFKTFSQQLIGFDIAISKHDVSTNLVKNCEKSSKIVFIKIWGPTNYQGRRKNHNWNGNW